MEIPKNETPIDFSPTYLYWYIAGVNFPSFILWFFMAFESFYPGEHITKHPWKNKFCYGLCKSHGNM